MEYPELKMKREDRKMLTEYQRPKFDPKTGLVWIEDGSAGVAVSAHPNVEANRITRKMHPDFVECRGFLYDTQNAVGSDDLSMLARKYCQCGGNH